MDVKISLNKITDVLSKVFHRFHVIIFAVIVAIFISIVTLFMSNTLLAANGSDEPSTTTGFDTATIEKVKQLKSAEEQVEYHPPSNQRINPFVE